jgi:hypothetical protein
MFYREIITVYFKNYKEHVMYYVDKTENVLMLNLVIRSVVADFKVSTYFRILIAWLRLGNPA